MNYFSYLQYGGEIQEPQKKGLIKFVDHKKTDISPREFDNVPFAGNRKFELGGEMNYFSFLKSGGSIHIKPENKGKFTETKKRTGKTTEELTHSKNPITRKRAIFAQNAKKWNHKK